MKEYVWLILVVTGFIFGYKAFADQVEKKTDGAFAGDSYQQQVKSSTLAPFAQENSDTQKDGVFVGEDAQKKTDSSFAGSNRGK